MQVYTSATHWGVFTARVHGGDIAAVAALASDTNPAPQLQNLPGAVRHAASPTPPYGADGCSMARGPARLAAPKSSWRSAGTS